MPGWLAPVIGGVLGNVASSLFGGGGGESDFNWEAHDAGKAEWDRQRRILHRQGVRDWKRGNVQTRKEFWRAQKVARRNYQRQLEDAQAWDRNKVRRLARDAKKAGLHPLEAMGVASSYSPGQIIGPSSGGGSGGGPVMAGSPDVGAQVVTQDMGSSGFGNVILDAMNMAMASRLNEAQIGTLQSETARNNAAAAAMVGSATSRSTASRARAYGLGAKVGGEHNYADPAGEAARHTPVGANRPHVTNPSQNIPIFKRSEILGMPSIFVDEDLVGDVASAVPNMVLGASQLLAAMGLQGFQQSAPAAAISNLRGMSGMRTQ